jgi:hypothetical protein
VQFMIYGHNSIKNMLCVNINININISIVVVVVVVVVVIMYFKYALCLIKDPDIVGLALFIRIRNLFILYNISL